MRIDAPWLHRTETQAVCAALTNAGFQALFVGGCVRNTLMGRAASDIDIATDALPEETMAQAEKAGLKAIPTGIDHGTITVVAGGIAHEITTFRADVDTDGRHATVRFSKDVSEDAARRDFTMNALYARPDGAVVDPLSGIDDLRAGRVRFIGDAEQRIREDYLRSLRFFRFFAWYGEQSEGLDADGLAAVAANLDGLENLSRERVGSEILKLLGAPDPAQAVAGMVHSGVLNAILPGASDKALGPVVHLEQMAGLQPDVVLRLAALGGGDVTDALRLSKIQAQRHGILRTSITEMKSANHLGYFLGERDGKAALILRAALLEQPFNLEDLAKVKHAAEAKLPVTAADLMPAYTGRRLGEKLGILADRWVASGFTLSREDLLK